jgi:hypothetical protein
LRLATLLATQEDEQQCQRLSKQTSPAQTGPFVPYLHIQHLTDTSTEIWLAMSASSS